MANTTNLNFKLFLESDYVDFNDINNNFEIIDSLHIPIKHFKSDLTWKVGNTAMGVSKWNVSLYADKEFEMSTSFTVSNLPANESIGTNTGMYKTKTINIPFPTANLEITGIDFVSLNTRMGNEVYSIPYNITETSKIMSQLDIQIASATNETTGSIKDKTVYITVKGVYSEYYS